MTMIQGVSEWTAEMHGRVEHGTGFVGREAEVVWERRSSVEHVAG